MRKNKNLESKRPLTISAQDGLVDQETYFNKRIASENLSNYILVKRGEFAYNKSYSSGFPWGAIKRLDKYENGVVSSLYIVFSLKCDQVDPFFLEQYFDTDRWFDEIRIRAAEGARNHGLLNIPASDFFDINLGIPSIDEQIEIGRFLEDISKTIALHQKKLCYKRLKCKINLTMFALETHFYHVDFNLVSKGSRLNIMQCVD
ncbi:hypothetical protein [Ileibacterium valens]|uniref:hypothetical protein n=1 Tax=Ileibacterium valens TaxID=1862668 RepID=UPI0025732C43|nr:hypothetical protein [Ileibacterium valens]